MKKNILLVIIGVVLVAALYSKYFRHDSKGVSTTTKKETASDKLHEGDLIFQTSPSAQSKAIQLATKSKYSHMGILLSRNGVLMVYEAVQPVKYTSLKEWIRRGNGSHYVVRRLKNSAEILTSSNLAELKKVGEQFEGKSYDPYFEWSDNRMYCSELVWKIYQRAVDVEIGSLQTLQSFDLSDPAVKAKLKERFGKKIPLGQSVISPQDMFDSKLLETVVEN